MSEVIKVKPEELQNAAKKINELANGYQTQYKNLHAKINDMGKQWSDEGNRAFVTQVNEFSGAFDRMFELMAEYSTFLNKSAEAYILTQKRIIEEAKKI